MVIRGKEAKRRMKTISQNVRGIKSVNRLEELFYVLSQRKNVVGVCLQETWRFDKEILEYESYRMITSGLTKNEVNGNRGSQGVGIILYKDGVDAWKAAGSESHVDLRA